MTLGESNLERNSLEIFYICIEKDGEPEACKKTAVDYAEDKAKQIQDYFNTMLEKTTGPNFRRREWHYRKETAIPDALERTKKKLSELTEEISV